MSLASCTVVDNTFGPHAKYCRGGFDFTLLFEESILSVVPLILLLGIIPLRILYLVRRTIKADGGLLLPSKLILYTIYGVIQVALVVLWASPTARKTKASVANAALALVGSLALALLSFVEHQRTIRPSLITEFYLGLSLLFDSVRIRTLWLQRYNGTVAATTTASLVIKLILLWVEAVGKRRVLRPEWQRQSPEATSGLWGKLFFWWLNPLFLRGFARSLSMEDMLPLDKHLTSDYLYHTLHKAWSRMGDQRSLLAVYFIDLKWHLLSVVPPRLALIGFTFCQPFLIQRAVNFMGQPVNESTTNVGYGLIGAYFLVYCGIALTTGQYQHLTYRAITMARGGLVSMLFAKTSFLEANAVDSAASLTLMSADIERITTGWQTMHEIWANVIEIALAIYLLERQLGVACVIPLAVAICSFLGSIFVVNLVVYRQGLWLEAMEKRISATTVMLGSMKRIKMCGLSEIFFENVHSLRLKELRVSKRFRRLLIGSIFFAFTTPVIAPVLTFTVFSLLALRNADSTLNTEKAFASLSLFALLTDPLSSLVMALTTFAGSFGCFGRIQTFLETREHQDKCIKHLDADLDDSEPSQTSGSSDESLGWTEKWTEKPIATSLIKKTVGPLPKASGDALRISDGSFGWDTAKAPVISSIRMKVPRGKLTVIVGPVGCGKSVLLKSLLGEVPTLSGTVKHLFSGDISYCDQSPFHMNGTIRDSILGSSRMDDRWYSTVLEMCDLEEDLQQLPQGDQTRIGSKGIALSGGQSQRVALARAVYARNDLCVLDDVFSGLDSDTEQRIFHNLLGFDGLLRRQGTTIILASSSNRRLPFADHIIALNEKGNIAEQGSFEDLNTSGGFVSSLDLPPAEWSLDPKETSLDRLVPTAAKAAVGTLSKNETPQAEEFEANKRTGDLSIYSYYAGSVGWLAVVVFIVSICSYVFCISFPQIWLAWWAEANAKKPNQNLGYWLGIYAMLGVVGLTSLVISCWQIIVKMVPQSGGNFHARLLKTVLAAPMSYFSTTDTGITLNRFSQDLQLIDMDLPLSALNFFTAFVLCIAQIILIGVSSVYAAISFPLWIVALYLIQKYYLRTSRQLRFLDLEAKSPLYTQFAEVIAGLTTVRAFGWQRALVNKNREMLDQSQKPFYLLFSVQRWLQLVLDLLVAAVAVMLMILVVELRGFLSGAYVGIALLNIILFSQHLKLVLQYWTMLETHIGAVSRVKNFIAATVPEDLLQEDTALPQDWPAQGAINFQSVSASYDGSRKVLKDLTLSIQAGEKVGVCGRTGSGKSSLVMALFRMLELHGGSITIDEVDISKIPRGEVRSRIIGLPQDVFLLDGTVRLNVDPFQNNTDKAIIGALQDVRLWETIQGKGGLEAQVAELNLSHGQKQLFCLAQALLRQSSILVLDEATSSVDDITDSLMQRIIRQKFSKHTIIAVAHKLDTILDFDKVAVLDNGVLREFENPTRLLEMPESIFSKIYNHSG